MSSAMENPTEALMTSNATAAYDEDDLTEIQARLGHTGRTLVAVYVTILAIGAATGNLLFLITIATNKSLRKHPLNILVTNLASSNFGIAIFSYPNLAHANFAGKWLYGDVGCTLDGFVTFFLSIVSLNTLVAIAIFRYLLMCRSDLKTMLHDRRTLGGMVLCCWVYALVWPLCPLFGWSKYTYEPFGTSCTVDWASSDKSTVAYNICLILFCFVLHLTVLVFCYGNIHRASKKPASLANAGQNNYESRVTKICILLVGSYVTCWTPYAVMSILSMVTVLPTNSTIVPTMFAKLSPCLDPTIYIFLNKKLRAIMGHNIDLARYTGSDASKTEGPSQMKTEGASQLAVPSITRQVE